MKTFSASDVIPDGFLGLLLELVELVNWFPFPPSSPKIVQEVLLDFMKILKHVLWKCVKPCQTLFFHGQSEGIDEGSVGHRFECP